MFKSEKVISLKYGLLLTFLVHFGGEMVLGQIDGCVELQGSQPSIIEVNNVECVNIFGEESNPSHLFLGRIVAREKISIKPPTYLHKDFTESNGILNLKIDTNLIIVEIVEGKTKIGKYEKLEIGLEIGESLRKEIEMNKENPNVGLNPFNPSEISIEASFRSPTGKIKTRFGFYYEEFSRDLGSNEYQPKNSIYNFLIRNSLDEIGKWNCEVRVLISGELKVFKEFRITCIDSEKKGRLKRTDTSAEKDRFLQFTENGERFFAIGENIATPSLNSLLPTETFEYLNYLNQFIEQGGNFVRLELGPQTFLPDWINYESYFEKMEEMSDLDSIVEFLELKDVYFLLFRHHTEVVIDGDTNSWDGITWQENPYFRNGVVKNRREYFTGIEAFKWQKQCLRYIFSRWGYSPSFLAYEYQEAERWLEKVFVEEGIEPYEEERDKLNPSEEMQGVFSDFREWLWSSREFIREELFYDDILFSIAYATIPKWELRGTKKYRLMDVSDFANVHKYGENKGVNYISRFELVQDLWEKYHKPVLVQEMGIQPDKIGLYCCTDVEFHNSLWATSMFGCMGTGLNWWWTVCHDKGYYSHFGAIADFFSTEDFERFKYDKIKKDADRFGIFGTDDYKMRNTRLEAFYIRDTEKEKCLGWVHNATKFWRNLERINVCVSDLISSKQNPPNCLKGNQPPVGNFDDEKFNDSFGEVQSLSRSSGETEFKVKSLKISAREIWAWIVKTKRHWYQVDYFSTTPRLYSEIVFSEMINTNLLGRIKPRSPSLGIENGDFAFKINYRGLSKDIPSFKSNKITGVETATEKIMEEFNLPTENENELLLKEREKILQDNLEVEIFPNPNSSRVIRYKFNFDPNCSKGNIHIVDSRGKFVQEFTIVSTEGSISLVNIPAGEYFVIFIIGDKVITKKVIFL